MKLPLMGGVGISHPTLDQRLHELWTVVPFAALDLGYEVARQGGTSGAVLNAANEVAVGQFLEGRLAFLDIARACKSVLAQHPFSPHPTREELMAADRWARQEVYRWTRQPLPNATR